MAVRGIGPNLTEAAYDFYKTNATSVNAGTAYVLEMFPVIYHRTLHGLKGKFQRGELLLLIDVLNGTMLTPQMAGQHLEANVRDGIELEGLDEKWQVKKQSFLDALAILAPWEKACLEFWLRAFWESSKEQTRRPEELEAWIKPLL